LITSVVARYFVYISLRFKHDVSRCGRALVVAGRPSEAQEAAEAVLAFLFLLLGVPLRRLCISSVKLCESEEPPEKIGEVLAMPVDVEVVDGDGPCRLVVRKLLQLPGAVQGLAGAALAAGGLAAGLYVAFRLLLHGVFHWVLALLAAFLVTWGLVLIVGARAVLSQRIAARLKAPWPSVRLVAAALVAVAITYAFFSKAELAAVGAYLLVAVVFVAVVVEYLRSSRI
jgi:hypothetical protein